MTSGMVGFGVLLWVRERASRAAVAQPSNDGAARAGRVVLGVMAALAGLVATIIGFRWRAGGGISALALCMPLAGLGWLAAIGARLLRLAAPAAAASVTNRPSRRPPRQDHFSSPTPDRPASPDGHISA
jgi:hypothetical protein